jgi:hypothetical protein
MRERKCIDEDSYMYGVLFMVILMVIMFTEMFFLDMISAF